MNDKKLGFALCGSFCTLERTLRMMAELVSAGWEIQPIMSPITYGTDTRFGTAEHWRDQVEALCGRPIWHTVAQVEPIGPRKLLDILLVAPCTGNTLGKLAGGITDTPVTMAVKAHLRNDRPVVLAVSTNDGLSASAANIGALLCRKNYYFVPFGQDDPLKKPTSLAAELSLTGAALAAALEGRQLQPMLRGMQDRPGGAIGLRPGFRPAQTLHGEPQNARTVLLLQKCGLPFNFRGIFPLHCLKQPRKRKKEFSFLRFLL